jgi:hypothetical protein
MIRFYYVAAAGDLSNDKVPYCCICKKQGYPHEPVKIQKIVGKVLSDGANEVLGYKLVDYITDRPHQHREPKKKQQQGQGRYYMGWDLEAFY